LDLWADVERRRARTGQGHGGEQQPGDQCAACAGACSRWRPMSKCGREPRPGAVGRTRLVAKEVGVLPAPVEIFFQRRYTQTPCL